MLLQQYDEMWHAIRIRCLGLGHGVTRKENIIVYFCRSQFYSKLRIRLKETSMVKYDFFYKHLRLEEIGVIQTAR